MNACVLLHVNHHRRLVLSCAGIKRANMCVCLCVAGMSDWARAGPALLPIDRYASPLNSDIRTDRRQHVPIRSSLRLWVARFRFLERLHKNKYKGGAPPVVPADNT